MIQFGCYGDPGTLTGRSPAHWSGDPWHIRKKNPATLDGRASHPFILKLLLFIYLDDLLMRGFVGHLEEGSFLPHRHETYLWTHLHFSFGYNKDQVVEANVTTVGATPFSLDDFEPPIKVTFTYSVSWRRSQYDNTSVVSNTVIHVLFVF